MTAGAPHTAIVLASSEVVGFAKTGGLADVCGYLPRALVERGHACAVVMPLYRAVRNGPHHLEATDHWLAVPLGDQIIPSRLWKSFLPGTQIPIFLIENGDLFERDDPSQGRGIYQTTFADGSKRDYPDNCKRFVFFCRAVMEAIPHVGFLPDILHANDWQTGLLPVYLKELYRHRPAYRHLRTLFTIHNIAYQGVFPHSEYHLTGLDHRLYNQHQLEFYGHFNFLKAGAVFADWINTVSPTYAREIQTTYFGCGMEGVLTERRDRLSGIVNGVDYESWDPVRDRHIAMPYHADQLEPGKTACKLDLQRAMHLVEDPRLPLMGMIARLVEQKGVELVIRCADELIRSGAQLVVLGDGDPEYHHQLRALQERHPRHVGLKFGFDETLAHRIEAGSDLYLMPSLFEPSGLNQLYSLRYGTPPVVRATGGLMDTVTDTNDRTLAEGTATGFSFQAFTPQALLEALQRAIHIYREQPELFRQIQRNGMLQDWSWLRSARSYEELYRRLIYERDMHPGSRLPEWR